jgi:hypothetical protein
MATNVDIMRWQGMILALVFSKNIIRPLTVFLGYGSHGVTGIAIG